ncbi:AI-2E family transporter [Tetragenococcus muriaticus]|uniref:Permease n=1 Tax=Tetragenococcus muriaticus 3MR10-3 TaxID=1302648 RepID=A0A091CDQ7_9ENTE|nr:AI-2E family transporter [Tetragenococcus muriaticus]KFN92358.1 hypothetical protein TMU3MR103_0487 [Tetragenococcus muriaticus 3MR10-3]
MDKKEKRSFSWFWKWFLDNKFVAGLLIIFLILVNINLFTKVSYLFFPVWQFLAIVALPIILAGILFYLLNPIVNFFEKRGIQRIYSIIGLFILVSGLIVWGVVVIIPEIREQVTMFVDRLPGYINTAENALNDFFSDPVFDRAQDQIAISSERIMSSVTEMVQNISRTTVQSIGNFFGAVASIFYSYCYDASNFILFTKRWEKNRSLLCSISTYENATTYFKSF